MRYQDLKKSLSVIFAFKVLAFRLSSPTTANLHAGPIELLGRSPYLIMQKGGTPQR